MSETINWYPGHMKKTGEMIKENLKAVDAVFELIDARIPVSSMNPLLSKLISNKKKIILINKADLADDNATAKWEAEFYKKKMPAFIVNSKTGEGMAKMLDSVNRLDIKKPDFRNLRLMVVGVPNVGKSSFINRLTKRKAAKTGDKPGVTRGKQWLLLDNGMQLLDTPGILWPKLEAPETGINLALCGSIRDEILDMPDLCYNFIMTIRERYFFYLKERYKLEEESDNPLEIMDEIAKSRGFILPGKKTDYERTARTVIDEFRSGIIGKITLEHL